MHEDHGSNVGRLEVRVTSLDERAAAALLDMAETWDVVGRYERSFFIASRAAGTLVSVVRNDLPDGPYTARLEPGAPRDLRTVDGAVRLAWGGARRWGPQLVAPGEATGPDELARRFAAIEERMGDAKAAGPAGARAILPPGVLAALEDAVAAGDAAATAAAVTSIAGLGPGLTPSGDDVLIGLLATHAWAEAAGFGGDPGLRQESVEAAAPRTTRLAAQLLAAAAEGCVTAPLTNLLASVFRRDGRFAPDVAGVLAIGATSGADMLMGVQLCGRGLVVTRRQDTR